MKKRLFIAWIIPVLVLACGACGKGEVASPDGAPAAAPNSPPASDESQSPGDLGAKIGSSYIETLKQVVAILNDNPPAADVKAMLTDLKKWTIELMVGLGREREALPESDRALVDSVLSQRITGVPTDLFKEYQAGQARYQDDKELFRLIADFNIITQYANFDLLKKQAPEEAQRLGIR